MLGASMALTGAYVGFSKVLVAAFPVFLLAGMRFAIAAVAMSTWLRKPVEEAPLTGAQKWLLFLESFFGNFLFSICMLYGIKLSTALAAGVVMSAIPAVCALLAWCVLGERISRRIGLAIALAAAGVALLSLARDPGMTAHDSSTASVWLGYALLFAAVCCEAVYVVVGKKLSSAITPRRISALINLWGLGLMLPLAAYQAVSFNFSAVSGPVWFLLVIYALAASVGVVWLWMTGLKVIPAANAGIMTVMLPISAAVVGIVFLNESAQLLHWLAFLLALTGLVLSTWPEGAVQEAPKN